MAIPFDLLGRVFARWGHRTYPDWAWPLFEEAVRGLPRRARLVDLGGGTGLLASRALELRPDLEALVVDPARGMLRHVPPGVRTLRSHAEELDLPPGSVRAVLVGEALHHFHDPGAALARVARILEPGGLLWIYDFDPREGVGRWVYWGERLLGEPARFVPPGRLLEQLEALGFAGGYRARNGRYVLTARLRAGTRRAAARLA